MELDPTLVGVEEEDHRPAALAVEVFLVRHGARTLAFGQEQVVDEGEAHYLAAGRVAIDAECGSGIGHESVEAELAEGYAQVIAAGEGAGSGRAARPMGIVEGSGCGYDVVATVEQGVVGGDGVGEIVAVERCAAELLEDDAEVVGVLHHWQGVALVFERLRLDFNVEVAEEEWMQFHARCALHHGVGERYGQTGERGARRGSLDEAERAPGALHASVGHEVVAARGEVDGHAVVFVGEALGRCLGTGGHIAAVGVVDKEREAVDLRVERVGILHVVVIDKSQFDTLFAGVEIVVYGRVARCKPGGERGRHGHARYTGQESSVDKVH